MTPKELMDNAVVFEPGGNIPGILEKRNDDGDILYYYVQDANGRDLIVRPGDYLVRDNIHKFTYEVVPASNVIGFQQGKQ